MNLSNYHDLLDIIRQGMKHTCMGSGVSASCSYPIRRDTQKASFSIQRLDQNRLFLKSGFSLSLDVEFQDH